MFGAQNVYFHRYRLGITSSTQPTRTLSQSTVGLRAKFLQLCNYLLAFVKLADDIQQQND